MNFGFLLSCFGHDRANNDSGVELLSLSYVLPKLSFWFCSVVFSFKPHSCELLCWAVCVHNVWPLDCVGVERSLLDKPSVLQDPHRQN